MNIYHKVCYLVEDFFVKILSKSEDTDVVAAKVKTYRIEQERFRKLGKEERTAKREEQQKLRAEQKARQKKELELLVFKVMEGGVQGCTAYEYKEIKNNQPFFQQLLPHLEPNEKVQAFIFCEYDNQSIKGYLFPTNKRVWFVSKDFQTIKKFRYVTMYSVKWFKDGMRERGLHIQSGKNKLEFDEMIDQAQSRHVGDTILSSMCVYNSR